MNALHITVGCVIDDTLKSRRSKMHTLILERAHETTKKSSTVAATAQDLPLPPVQDLRSVSNIYIASETHWLYHSHLAITLIVLQHCFQTFSYEPVQINTKVQIQYQNFTQLQKFESQEMCLGTVMMIVIYSVIYLQSQQEVPALNCPLKWSSELIPVPLHCPHCLQPKNIVRQRRNIILLPYECMKQN